MSPRLCLKVEWHFLIHDDFSKMCFVCAAEKYFGSDREKIKKFLGLTLQNFFSIKILLENENILEFDSYVSSVNRLSVHRTTCLSRRSAYKNICSNKNVS